MTQDALRHEPGWRPPLAAVKLAVGLAVMFFAYTSLAPLAAAATLTITPATLPNAQVGAAYSQALTASPAGNGPYTWSLASGSQLPAGLSLASSTSNQVNISGTPTAAGDPAFTVQVTDGLGNTGSQAYTLTITKGAPVITWANPPDITYGTALGASQLDATANVPGSFTYSPALDTVLNAGNNQTLSVRFTPADGFDYTTSTATVSINVALANSTLTVGTSKGEFDQRDVTLRATVGSTIAVNSGTVTFTVINSSNQQVGTALTSPETVDGKASVSFPLAGLPIGDYFVDASYAGSSNFNPSTGTGSLTITQATPVIIWHNPTAMQYGTPLSGTQLSALAKVPGTFAYSPAAGAVLDVGQQELSATFTPTDTTDFTSASVSVKLDVVEARTRLTLVTGSSAPVWNAVYGDAQVVLDALITGANPVTDGMVTFSVSSGSTLIGNVTANVADGSVSIPFDTSSLNAGRYHVAAVYDGSVFFARSAANGVLIVKRASPGLTWATPADIPFGTALSSTQLKASASFGGAALNGTLVYGPALGAVLPIGTAETLRVRFIPTDTANFDHASMTVPINVVPAPSSVYVPPTSAAHTAAAVTITARLSSTATVNAGTVTFTLTNSGGVSVGSVSASVARGVATANLRLRGLSAGSYTISAAYGGSAKFVASTGSGTLTLT